MNSHEKFSFGKHKGKTLRDVIKEDPGYVDWANRTIPNFNISKENEIKVDNYLDNQGDDEDLSDAYSSMLL